MELMRGVVFYVQSALFGLALLFCLIAFGGGLWWESRHLDYDFKFTLWQLCTKHNSSKVCTSMEGEHLQSVVLTVRACMGIVLIFLTVELVCIIIWFVAQRRSPAANDTFLMPRTISFLFIILFMLVVIAHAHHCRPCYSIGSDKMEATVEWGWSLCVAAFFFVLVPCGIHCAEQFLLWKSDRLKR